MKIAAVRLFVEDIAAARSFYADLLGFQPVSLESAVLVFDAGPLLIVEQADAEARAEGLAARFAGVSFSVSDIETLHARLKASGCTICTSAVFTIHLTRTRWLCCETMAQSFLNWPRRFCPVPRLAVIVKCSKPASPNAAAMSA